MCARLLAVVVLWASLSACPPPIDTGDGGDGPIVVGPKGGLFIRPGFGLNVPAGAVSTDTAITVSIIDDGMPEVAGRKRISYGYQFSPTTLSFAVPVTVYLPWLHERVPTAVDPNSFDLRRQTSPTESAVLSATKTDTDPFEAVEGQSDHLGVFWVTSPIEPNVDRLEVTPRDVLLRVDGGQVFSARVVAPTGETLVVPVTWDVTPARVGVITHLGQFTAKNPGVATVTARAAKHSASVTVAVVGAQSGPSQWVHENPSPTGNDLFGGLVAPLGLGALMVGDNGTVLAHGASGTWAPLFSTPNVTLLDLAGTNQDDAVAVGHLGTSGVLVEFHGTQPPTSKIFRPTDIGDLGAVWFDGTTGMGVGTGNQVVIRRDGGWTTEYHPSFERLLSVIGDGAGAFVVVGELGSLYRWDPVRSVWDSLYDQRLGVHLDAARLVVSTPAEAWAVGGHALWHFSAGAWSSEGLPSTPVLAQTTTLGVVDGHVVVGGTLPLTTDPLPASRGAVLVRSASLPDGGTPLVTWTSQPLRGLQVPRGLFGRGTEGYVVGELGAVWRWNATTQVFDELSSGFQGDVADLSVASDEVFAAVNECLDLRCLKRSGHVMRGGRGRPWVELGTLPSTAPLTAIVASDASNVLVSNASGVYRWDGNAWAVVPVSGATGAVLDLRFCGTTVWAAGEGGSTYRGTGLELAHAGSAGPGTVNALTCLSDSEQWAAGSQFLASRISGLWQSRTSASVNQAPWRAVWSPGPGEAFAFGDARYGVYFDTAHLTAQESLGLNVDVVNGLAGDSIDNLVMVGRTQLPLVTGFASRFDGVNWHPVDVGARRMATCIDGPSSANLWIGTEGGGLLRVSH